MAPVRPLAADAVGAANMATIRIGGRAYDVTVRGSTVVVDGVEYPATVRNDGAYLTVSAGGVSYRVAIPAGTVPSGDLQIEVDHRPTTVRIEGLLGAGAAQRAQPAAATAAGRGPAARGGQPGAVAAQIAGRVISIKVKVGDAVKSGDVLLLLEAMKMENEIKAPTDGVVREIPVREGDRVAEGDTLAVIGSD